MSQPSHQDLESGNDANTGGHPGQPQSTRNPSLLSSQGGNDDRDSSWPLYAMYYKIAQEEDNNDAERHQQRTDGILVFTGLFSATVAALLAVTIPDLKSNSQDTSAFYLEHIYQLSANPNASVGSIPSTLAKPPPFSPPTYLVLVNCLWLSALILSLSGATLATVEREYVSRRISITQNKEYLPEMRARIRAMLIKRPYSFFKTWRRLELLTMLHLSLFLFLAGVLIYSFNMNAVLFVYLAPCIAYFVIVYTAYTFAPLFRPTELFSTPLSFSIIPIYLAFLYATSRVWSLIAPHSGATRMMRYHDLCLRFKEWLNEGRRSPVAKAASKPSQEIDTEVLERMLHVLDNDHAFEGLFCAIPGFCDSRMVHKPLDVRVTTRLQQTLDAFLDRTFSSHLVTQPVRNDRLITCLNAAYSALGPRGVSQILGNFFNGHRDEALKSVEIGHSLVRWGHSKDVLIEPNVRRIVARIIAHSQERDDRWAKLVKEAFHIPDGAIRDYLAHGDSVLLAILVHVTREALLTDHLGRGILKSLSRFDIRNTSAELQHDFCALWNEIVQEARNKGTGSTPTQILAGIRHLFTTLHRRTNAAPIRFPAPISDDDNVLSWPWSYRSCNIASHHPDSAAENPATTPLTVPPPTPLGDSQNVPPNPTLPSQLPLNASQELATENAAVNNADVSVTSGIANPIHSSDSGGSSALQQAGEVGTMPHPSVLGSLPPPIPTPALHSANSVVLPPSIESALMQTDHDRHSLGAPSSTSTTMPLSVIPQVATVADQYPDICGGSTGAQYDNENAPLLILSEDQSPPGGATGL